jgi:hypothetical protein
MEIECSSRSFDCQQEKLTLVMKEGRTLLDGFD